MNIKNSRCHSLWLALLGLLLYALDPVHSQLVSSIGYGTPERFLDTTDTALHVIKAAPGEVLKYYGNMGSGRTLALVEATQNGNSPCDKSEAGAAATNLRSGPCRAPTGSYNVVIPQNPVLDWDNDDGTQRLYAVCAASGAGDTNDATWEDSAVRLRLSAVASIAAHGVTHKTTGRLARHAALKLTVAGELGDGKWISMVEATLNTNNPCASGAVAAAPFVVAPPNVYSGPLQTASNVATMNTAGMMTVTTSGSGFASVKTEKIFALCFSNSVGGTTGDTWYESGLRITVSKISTVEYGEAQDLPYSGFPMRSFAADDGAAGTVLPWYHVLPSSEFEVVYRGDLPNGRYLSLVDVSLNGGNPCGDPAVAGAGPDAQHSSVEDANTFSTRVKFGDAKLAALDHSKLFALCYAEAGGSTSDNTYRDTYIRLRISKVRSMQSHGVSMQTQGHIPRVDGNLIYDGQALANNKWISILDSTLNTNNPCGSGAVVTASADATHSGVLRAGTSNKQVAINTLTMDSSKVYAVCYAGTGGSDSDAWYDTAIRLTLAKLNTLTYGPSTPAYPARVMTSFSPRNRGQGLPQKANVQFILAGELPVGKKVALVDSQITFDSKPCKKATTAAAAEDTQHSGPLTIGAGKSVTLPQGTLLDNTKTFSLCYAENDGDDQDNTWRDSYIRLVISKIETLAVTFSDENDNDNTITFTTQGHLPKTPILRMVYAGTLPAAKWLSLVASTENNNAPCETGASAAGTLGSTHSGPQQAVGAREVAFNTKSFVTTTQFALCYTEVGGTTAATWLESGLRFDMSKVATVAYANPTVGTALPAREWTAMNALPAVNRLPSIASATTLTLMGTIDDNKYISLVDANLNSGDPCSDAAHAAATADSTHSGAIQATGKVVTLLQATLLSLSTTFTVCYAENPGNAGSWRDTYVRVIPSKLLSVSTHEVTTRTDGSLARMPGLQLVYNGLPASKWISLVDADLNPLTLNTNTNDASSYPCKSGTVAAAATDATHSGSLAAPQAASCNSGPYASGAKQQQCMRTVTFSTASLSTAKSFAVCYTEAVGTDAAAWYDSGIRLVVSKVTSVQYGYNSPSIAPRQWLSTFNYLRRDNADEQIYFYDAKNRMPQSANTELTYVGDLANNKHLSIVDVRLNNKNPCIQGSIAAAAADTRHSGAVQAGAANKMVTVPQSTALSEKDSTDDTVPGVYTICYAEGDGTASDVTWRDSYVRVQISKVTTLSSHGVSHKTDGTMPRVAGLEFTYAGTLAHSMYVSLVHEILDSNFPCAQSGTAAASQDVDHSGVLTATSSSVVTTSTLAFATAKAYAVCYSETVGSGDMWLDSGIRLKPSLITTVGYGSDASRPQTTTLAARRWTSANVVAATSRLPQADGVILEYVGDLVAAKWVSIVDASLNNNNPCVDGSVAAAMNSTQHSGAVQASGKVFTIPSTMLFDLARTYTVCYAETSGLANDVTWRDSYVRVKLSLLQSVASHQVTHVTEGTIPWYQSFVMTYRGNIAANSYVSFVSETLNGNFPCASTSVTTHAPDATHTGAMQGNTRRELTISSTALSTTAVFAVCYGLNTNMLSWRDSGIRLRVSKVTHLSYGNPIRTMNSAPLRAATDRFPMAPNVGISYHGYLASAKYISLVSVHLNQGNPCMNGADAAGSADMYHSGAVQATSITMNGTAYNQATIPQSTILNRTYHYTFCYAEGDGSASDTSWRDSYVRVELSAIHKVSVPAIAHDTTGHISRLVDAALSYTGDLAGSMWISLVDSQQNSYNPCISPSQASHAADAYHSGPIQASSSKVVTVNTDSLFSEAGGIKIAFAVCYNFYMTSSQGWLDSGIRVEVAKIGYIKYAPDAGLQGRVISGKQSGANSVPFQADIPLSYHGLLAKYKWISFVRQTDFGGRPCDDARIAAKAYNASEQFHSGPLRAGMRGNVNDTVVLPMMNGDVSFAVCYAEQSGTTQDQWYESTIRLALTKIFSVVSHDVTTKTVGQVARYNGIEMTYAGLVGPSAALSLVADFHNDNLPCVLGSQAGHTTDSTHSGAVTANAQRKGILNTATLNANYLYAVCYNEFSALASDTRWRDSGIRVGVSKIDAIVYGPDSSSFPARRWVGSPTIASTARMPQSNGVSVSYDGYLAPNMWVSVVQASLNGGDPCSNPSLAAVKGGEGISARSGAIQAGSTKSFRVPLAMLGGLAYTFCYAETDGSASDATWRDSFIRVTLTKLNSLTSDGVSVVASGSIVNLAVTDFRLDGSIAAFSYLSLVDHTLNSNQPCALGLLLLHPQTPLTLARVELISSMRRSPGGLI